MAADSLPPRKVAVSGCAMHLYIITSSFAAVCTMHLVDALPNKATTRSCLKTAFDVSGHWAGSLRATGYEERSTAALASGHTSTSCCRQPGCTRSI